MLAMPSAPMTPLPKVIIIYCSLGNYHSLIVNVETESLTPLENSILQLSEGLNAVRDKTEYAKTRDRVCRNSMSHHLITSLTHSFSERAAQIRAFE
jgi:hypothetical protein